jgi:hypothetical protein
MEHMEQNRVHMEQILLFNYSGLLFSVPLFHVFHAKNFFFRKK